MEEKRNQKTELKNGHKKASKVIFVVGVLLAVAIIFACVTSIVLLFFSVEELTGCSILSLWKAICFTQVYRFKC